MTFFQSQSSNIYYSLDVVIVERFVRVYWKKIWHFVTSEIAEFLLPWFTEKDGENFEACPQKNMHQKTGIINYQYDRSGHAIIIFCEWLHHYQNFVLFNSHNFEMLSLK